MRFPPVFEVEVSDPSQHDCAEQGQGVSRIKISSDQGTDDPVHPRERDEQAQCGDHNKSREQHVFSCLW